MSLHHTYIIDFPSTNDSAVQEVRRLLAEAVSIYDNASDSVAEECYLQMLQLEVRLAYITDETEFLSTQSEQVASFRRLLTDACKIVNRQTNTLTVNEMHKQLQFAAEVCGVVISNWT